MVAALSGCGGGSVPDSGADPPAVLTVAEALGLPVTATEVAVRGYVLAGPTAVVRLCTGLAGSFPPQCGAPSIMLTGMDVATLPERDPATGVSWSGEMTVTGELDGETLAVRGS